MRRKLVGISDNYKSAFGEISNLVNGRKIISRRINTRLLGLVKETSPVTSQQWLQLARRIMSIITPNLPICQNIL